MMLKVCAEPGCPTLCASTRCTEHARARDKARGTRQERGYDAAYDQRRREDMHRYALGEVLYCWRCEKPVFPHDYSLGHCDDDRTVIHGAEHLRVCNLANTRGGCPHPSHAGISPAA